MYYVEDIRMKAVRILNGYDVDVMMSATRVFLDKNDKFSIATMFLGIYSWELFQYI